MGRGISPVVGVATLVVLTVVLSVAVGAVVPELSSAPQPTAQLSVTAAAQDQKIAITHEGGDTLDVRDLDVEIRIDGESLTHQPPVPFFSARGFVSGPEGPFNPASESTWRAGETATLYIAETNDPTLTAGTSVTVTIVRNGATVHEERITAR